ncbi:type IV pilus modification protein PilV [Marinimicrobium locisalis]|uniref:type IV pilus modification protein PilV n=1 Tax=Marinimicrobium locisalis TaxID=546022 RepID=UPI003221907B
MTGMQSLKRQEGVGLIEVLVTVMILATSLLAMGALQSRSLAFNHSAYLRSQANVLAYDVLDRIRINRENVDDYDGLAFDDEAPNGNALAAQDMRAWLAQAARLLPGGDGEIECDNNLCTVRLRWIETDEPEEGEPAGEPSYTVFTYSSRV